MSQRVPSWDVHYINHSNSTDLSKLEDYEVAELTWQNGKISMNGFSLPRVPAKPFASGTLESIVNQATRFTADRVAAVYGGDSDGFNRRRAAASNTMTMDALVPCSNGTEEQSTTGVVDSVTGGAWRRVGCCSKRRAGVARVHVDGGEWSSRDQSVSGRDSHHVTLDTFERELDSPENTSSARQWRRTAASVEDLDSVCHSTQRDEGDEEYLEDNNKRSVKSSVSNKRSRAAAVHNQSERKRRDKINQRMSTLQKLVPNSSKTDKASILDEVIEYVKQLQAQLQMMSRMSMSSMMLPMNMPHQLNMSMMAPMGMGLGMGLGLGPIGMDMTTLARPSIPILHPTTTFMPMTSWDPLANGGTLTPAAAPPGRVMSDPFSSSLACLSRPMTMDAYSKMVAMYQQLQQMDPSSSKS